MPNASVNVPTTGFSGIPPRRPSVQAPTYHLNFDGVDDKVTIPASTSLNNLPLGDFTIEWSGSLPTDSGDVMSKMNAATFEGWEVYNDSGNFLNLFITYDDYAKFINVWCPIDSSQHHYEIVFVQSPKTVKIFIDGISQPLTDGSSGSYGIYDDDSANNITVADDNSDDFHLAETVNWIRISDIARHTANFTPPSLTICPPADGNTVLRLALDEGTGTVANDTSGNGNNGTISGAAWELD